MTTKTRAKRHKAIAKVKNKTDLPEWSTPATDTEIRQGLTHFNQEMDTKQSAAVARKFVAKNYPSSIEAFKNAPDWAISKTFGSLCAMLETGCTLPDRYKIWFNNSIQEIVKRHTDQQDEEATMPVVRNPHAALEAKTAALVGEIEERTDANEYDFGCYEFLQKNEAAAQSCAKIAAYFEPYIEELEYVLKSKDQELKDSYRLINIRKKLALYKAIVSDCQKMIDGKAATRKPRKVRAKKIKPQSFDKFKYLKHDPILKISSQLPEKVVGASACVLFNTKYQAMTFLHSNAPEGLQIKGQTIQNIDPEKSATRRVGRNLSLVEGATKTTKFKLQKDFGNLKAKPSEATGRVNSDTLILVVFK